MKQFVRPFVKISLSGPSSKPVCQALRQNRTPCSKPVCQALRQNTPWSKPVCQALRQNTPCSKPVCQALCLETFSSRIPYVGSTSTFLYFDLYLNTAYAAHYVYFTGRIVTLLASNCLFYCVKNISHPLCRTGNDTEGGVRVEFCIVRI